MNDMTPYKSRSRPNPYIGHAINAGNDQRVPNR